MTIPEMKNYIKTLSKDELEDFTVSNYVVAARYLAEVTDSVIDRRDYLFFLMCALAYTKGLWSESSAGREETVELIRSVLKPLYASIESKTGEKSTPILYQKVSVTMDFFADDAEFSHNLFALTLEKLYKISREEGCRPLVDALYGAAALFIGLDDPAIEAFMKHSVDDAWEYAFFQNNPGIRQAVNKAVNKAVSKEKRKKWRPLKIYLIISTIIIVGGIALALVGLTNDAIHSSISVTTVSGEKVQVEPGMAPVELPIFGMTDYDGIIGGLKTATIIFAAWRVILIVLVYIIAAALVKKRAGKRR